MKISSRPGLLSTLAFVLLGLIAVATILSFIIRHNQKNEINGALAILERNNLPLIKVEQTLGSLFNAEIEFREYTINYDKIHLDNYHNHIRHLVANIDTLQQIVNSFNKNSGIDAIETIKKREKQAENYLRLKKLTDSLMIVALTFESSSFVHSTDNFNFKQIKPTALSLNIDTLNYSMTSEKKKKGLLGKIKTFLVGEEEKTTSNAQVVVKSGTEPEMAKEINNDTAVNLRAFADNIIDKTSIHYQRQLRKQLEKRNELRAQELKLVNLNNNLLTEIRSILNTFKSLTREYQSDSHARSSRTIARSSTILQRTLLFIILLAFPLAVFTMIMLRRNQMFQKRILESKQLALYQAEEKSRFLSYMSHEFRTPLASVIGFAEQLEDTKMSHDQRNYLSGLMSSSEMLLATVNDILDLSKLDAGKMSFLSNPFRPDETVLQVIKSFSKMAGDKSVELSFSHNGNMLTLLGDEIRLKQVLNNLVSNAIKYTHQGTVSIVSTISERKDLAELIVEVSDTGIGIDSDKVGKIFDEYTRVHSETPEKWIIGTGLGLAVTKKLVDQMGGKVTVKSKKGEGSVFTISIPYPVSRIQQIKAIPKPAAEELPEKEIRILVADDNYFSVVLLKSIFKRDNIVLDVAENGLDALNKLSGGNYDILLSDMYMPQMDGLELTRQIRSSKTDKINQLPVIMLTGNISPDAVSQMGSAGVNDFLIKPFHRRDLIGLVSKHLS